MEILQKHPRAKIIALDQDTEAWERAKEKFQGLEDRILFVRMNFREMGEKKNLQNFCAFAFGDEGTGNPRRLKFSDFSFLDAVIFDLGLSSDQLENSGLGFSFLRNEPLLMTFKRNPGKEDLTAGEILNTWEEKNLASILYGFGEEKFARKIAKAIVEARKEKEIKTTFELVEIIKKAVPAGYLRKKIHFATRTFQALRIAVNDELGALKSGLEKGFEVLKKEGRMAVISFHSLEDRIVKNFCREKSKRNQGRLINKKPLIAGEEELEINPRARSAKLRILSRL